MGCACSGIASRLRVVCVPAFPAYHAFACLLLTYPSSPPHPTTAQLAGHFTATTTATYPSNMNGSKLVVLAALTLGVASFATFNGVPSRGVSSKHRVGGLTQPEGNTTIQSLPLIIFQPHVDHSYQGLYGPQLVVATPLSAPVNPLLLLDNASCGMEDEAAEMAKMQGTSPVRPLADDQVMVKPAYISAYDQGPAEVCELLWCPSLLAFPSRLWRRGSQEGRRVAAFSRRKGLWARRL